MKFYTSDWRNDPALKMCSMAARGLWIEMICLMHQATPYGHLLVNGQCPTDAQLAVLVGAPSDQIAALLGELEAAGIFSRTKEGTIYSRKLSRMAKKAATARNNGRKGGNPSLRKERDNQPSDKGRVKGEDKPQKPEARSQSSSVSKDTAPPGARDPSKVVFDEGVALLARSGLPEKRARPILGKWRSQYGDEAVISALGRAQREGAIDPVSFCEGVFRFEGKRQASKAPDIGEERMIRGEKHAYQGAVGGWVRVYE